MLGLTMAYSDVSELLVTISDYCIKFVFTKGDRSQRAFKVLNQENSRRLFQTITKLFELSMRKAYNSFTQVI